MNRDRLKQEPSGDLISREETLTAFADYVGSGMSMDDFDALCDIVAKMPAVNPTKIGHWIPRQEIIGVDKEGNEISATFGYKCSKCLIVHPHTSIFCPSCGAKMIEPQGI